ncbi:hypothetical protein JZU68_00725, partial [bacterium]|nr:hypothetical protein [bacterium]
MSNFDSNGMADANTIDKMKADYGLLTSNISALSSAGINDMMKSALVTELGSFNSLFTKNEQAVKVEVVAGMLSVADQAKALGLTESQVTELQKSNGYSSTQIDKLYAISTTQATNKMLGSVNEWVKSLYDVQSQARALDTASLSSSSFAAGHVFGTQEKIDFAQKTGLTIGSESFNKAITDIQGFATKSDDVGYLAGLSGLNGSSVSNTSILSSIKSLGSLAPSDAQSALTGVSSLLHDSAVKEYWIAWDARSAEYNKLTHLREDATWTGSWTDLIDVASVETAKKYGFALEGNGTLANHITMQSMADKANELPVPVLKTNFGFAVGTPNVPYDMTANIHKGEIIVPQNFSEGLRNGSLNMGSNKELIEEIRALRK